MYLHLGSPDRSSVPRDVQEASQADFGAISDPSGRLWKPKNTVKYKVFAIFHVAPQTSPSSSKSAPWKAQNDLQEAPGSARDAPGAAKKAPRQLQERQKRPKSAPRAGFRAPLAAKLGPTGTESRPKVRHRPFWTPRGLVLHPPGVDCLTVFFSRKA